MDDSKHNRPTVSVPRQINGLRLDNSEGGILEVQLDADGVVLRGGAMALRDLARWALALSDGEVDGQHVHFDPGVSLSNGSLSLVIERVEEIDE